MREGGRGLLKLIDCLQIGDRPRNEEIEEKKRCSATRYLSDEEEEEEAY